MKALFRNWTFHVVTHALLLAAVATGGLVMFAGGLIGMAAGGQAFLTYAAYGKFLAAPNDAAVEKLRLTIIMMSAFGLKVITLFLGYRLQAEWGNPAALGLAAGLLWVYFSAVGWLMATSS